MEKSGRAREATDDNITRRMRFACRISKATNIPSKSVILIAFPQQDVYPNAPQFYVILTLHLSFLYSSTLTLIS